MPDLFPYQETGAAWLHKMPTAMLADEMGLGKTCQAITAADTIRAKSILVLCPGIARENWSREIQSWSKYKRNVGIVENTKKGVPKTDIVVASYSILGSRDVLIKLLEREWDLLVCDEAHFLKSRQAVRTKAVYGAKCDRSKGIASRAKRVFLLTGTPTPNNLSEFWTHARALFPNAVMGLERFSSWEDKFCVMDQSGVRILNSKNHAEFVQRVKPYVLRRRAADVLKDLPSLRTVQVVVRPESLPPQSQSEKDSEAIVRSAIAERIAKNGGELTEEDLHFINYKAGMHVASIRKWTGISKAHSVAQLIKDDFAGGMNKVVIFACHREVFNILLKELPGSAAIHGGTPMDERDRLIDRFQGKVAGHDLKIIIVHLDIASTAITLTAAHNAVYAETAWTPSQVQQATGRLHRIGQKMPVLARIVSLADSIDEAIAGVLVRKSTSINKTMKALEV